MLRYDKGSLKNQIAKSNYAILFLPKSERKRSITEEKNNILGSIDAAVVL